MYHIPVIKKRDFLQTLFYKIDEFIDGEHCVFKHTK